MSKFSVISTNNYHHPMMLETKKLTSSLRYLPKIDERILKSGISSEPNQTRSIGTLHSEQLGMIPLKPNNDKLGKSYQEIEPFERSPETHNNQLQQLYPQQSHPKIIRKFTQSMDVPDEIIPSQTSKSQKLQVNITNMSNRINASKINPHSRNSSFVLEGMQSYNGALNNQQPITQSHGMIKSSSVAQQIQVLPQISPPSHSMSQHSKPSTNLILNPLNQPKLIGARKPLNATLNNNTQVDEITNSSVLDQLQIDADQNRLDFMLEKGQNFQKQSQLSKLINSNNSQQNQLRQNEHEINKLKDEVERLKLKLKEMFNASYNPKPVIEQTAFESLQEKVKMNSYFKSQLASLEQNSMKQQNVFLAQIEELQSQLMQAKESNPSSGSSITSTEAQTPKKIIKLVESEAQTIIEERNDNQSQLNESQKDLQIEQQYHEIESLQSTNSSLITNLNELTNQLKFSNQNFDSERNTFKIQINKLEDKIVNIEGNNKDLKQQLEQIQNKLSLVKDSGNLNKIKTKNEYSLFQTELLNSIEESNRKVNAELIIYKSENELLKQKQKADENNVKRIAEELVSKDSYIEWLKKQGISSSKLNGTFNYTALAEDIYPLKNILDRIVKESPHSVSDSHVEFSEKMSEILKVNSELVDIVNKIRSNLEKDKKSIESIPILKQFENADVSVAKQISCGKCHQVLSESITCVPCGHNFCSKCHYEGKQIQKDSQDDNSICCSLCGPSTMIYRNEALDEITSMYNIMKNAKEIMKVYLRSN